MAFENIIVERQGGVGTITINRPKALNALSAAVMTEISDAVDEFEADDKIGALVVTGSEKAFAAGADIKEMQSNEWPETYTSDFITTNWERLGECRKPVIAAVAGFALGGGCELAMMCDFIIAADNAKFGQPEITLGIPPGLGGTQRLTHAVGKAKSMEMCLTGRMMDAEEAERAGLISRIVPVAELMEEAIKAAQRIADMSPPVAMMVKESINRANEIPQNEGIRFERRLFQACFGADDQKEGMAAFIDKRPPKFGGR